jgi:hypothetical protein
VLALTAGVGIAIALTPAAFRAGPLSRGCQAFLTAYLLIGLAQAWLFVPEWWRIRTSLSIARPAPYDPREFIRFGCKLTLPTSALLILALLAWKCAAVSILQRSAVEVCVGLWLLIGLMFQAGGLIVNLKNCMYLTAPIDLASKRIAVLNVAHTLAFALGLWMGWLNELL